MTMAINIYLYVEPKLERRRAASRGMPNLPRFANHSNLKFLNPLSTKILGAAQHTVNPMTGHKHPGQP
jgi:hypothetical protein